MATKRRTNPTVGDLRNLPAGAFQLCRVCGNEYSANHSDYVFAARGDATPLTCCGKPVRLMTKRTVYSDVR